MRVFRSTTPRPLSISLARLSSAMAVAAALSVNNAPSAKAATEVWRPIAGSSLWDLTTANWDTSALWVNGNVALFNALGFASPAVNITAPGITAAGVQFDLGGYTIGGAGTLTLSGASTVTVTNAADVDTISAVIGGTTGLVKNGLGTLVLTGANTFTGGTTVNAGTLGANIAGSSTTVTATGVTTAASSNPLSAGPVTLAGGTLQLTPVATTTTNGLSGRVFAAAPTNNDSTQVNFSAAASSTRYDANLYRTDLTTASGGGTALNPTTNVAVQWTGKLQVTNAGGYRFFTASDDGSRVFVDGVLVVNNDGSKGTTDLGSTVVALSAGLHDIRVDYTQGGGGGSELLSWAGATTGLDAPVQETAIPSASLFTAESNTTAGASNAVIAGAGNGDALVVSATSTVNLNGSAFSQVQLGALSQNTGTTLNVTGLAGKTLRFSGDAALGNGAGTVTLNNTPNVALDGLLTDGGNAVTLTKTGAGRLIFDQTAVANTLGAASSIDLQGGTVVLIGAAGGNNPIGAAGLRLNGGNVVLDTKTGGATYDNAISVLQDGTIQDTVAGVGPIATTLGSAANGITIAATKTLTLDAITGGNNVATNISGSTEGGAQITVAGAITGGGSLNTISTSFGNNATPGVILLNNAANTFAGAITVNGTTFTGNTTVPVNGPTLRVGVAGALPSAATNTIFVKSGALDFNNTNFTSGSAITLGGGPALTTSNITTGTGTLTLGSDLVYDAANNAGTGTVAGKLDLNSAGLRTINVGDSSNAYPDLIVNALVSGTGGGGFIKTGAGTMALQAGTANQTNAFTGNVQVAAGTLIVGGGANAFTGDKAIAGAGSVQIDAGAIYKAGASNIIENTRLFTVNGTLDMSGFSETLGNISGNGIVTSNLSGAVINLDLPNNAPTFTGAVTGQVALTIGGRLATANATVPTSQFSTFNYNGNTIIGDGSAASAITLQLSANNALVSGFNKGDLTITGTGTAGKGGILDLAGFNQTLNGLNGASATQNPIITNSGATDSILTVGAANSGGTFSGIIRDGGTNKITLVKMGLGSETLGGPNTYTGLTTINNGRLGVSNTAALGAAAAGTVVNSGGYLDVVNISIAEPLTLNGRGQPVAFSVGAPGAYYTGALQGSGGLTAAVTGPVTLGSNTSIGVVKGSLLTISSVIGDGGSAFSLTKTQGDGTAPGTGGPAGTLLLTGANTYTGTTLIEAGELRLANPTGQAIQSTSVTIGNGSNDAILTLGANQQMLPGVILNFNDANKNAKFNLNGFTQTVAGFTNTGALPIIQNFEGTPAPGAGTLIVANPADTTFSGLIRDQVATLNVTKQGAGTLIFSGNNAWGTAGAIYTGATTISAGKLQLVDETAFNSPITLTTGGTGALEFNYSYGRSLVYGKTLIDNGLGFTKTGLGNLAINGVGNLVTGPVSVNSGVLNLTDATGNVNPLPGAPITVLAGAQLQFLGVSAVTTTFNNNITLKGLTPGGAFVGATAGGNPTDTLTGTLTLDATSNISTAWSDKTLNITGKITGPGGLVIDKLFSTQQPPIINITSTTNDYAGGTTINSGTVTFTAGSLPATGNLKFGSTFGNGGNFGTGQLVLSAVAGSTFTRSVGTGAGQVQFTGDGGGFSAIGALGTVTFGNTGPIDWSGKGTTGLDATSSLVFNSGTGANNEVNLTNDLNLNGGMRRISVNASQARLSGSLSGTGGLIIDGGATLLMSGATGNTYTGRTDLLNATLNLNKTSGVAIPGDIHIGQLVGNGIVVLGASEQIADTAIVSFDGMNAANGWLRLNGFTETVGGISDRSGGGVIENVTGTAGVLIVNNAADSFFNGFFRNGTAGTLALTKNGAGTLTISAGQQSGTGNQIYTGATNILNGTLKLANTESFNSAITLGSATSNIEFAPNFNRTHTYGLVISGTGNLVKSGGGTLVLSGGSNSYGGTSTVNAGTLQINSTQAAGQTGNYIVNSTGTLLIGNGTTAGALTNNNNITVNAGGLVAFNRNNALTYSGVISGAGNLENRASGVLTLSGANSYTGITTGNAGTINLSGSGVSAGGLIINSGATLNLDFTQLGSSASGIVAAAAPVTLNGGNLVLTGAASGTSTQALGTVLVNNGVNSINPIVGAGGALTLTTGVITRVPGSLLNFNVPAGLTAAAPAGAGIGGILGGYATSNNGATFLGINSFGNLTPLATFSTDIWNGTNVDATASTTQGASAAANSLRFNTAGALTLTLDGATTSTIASGGILETSAVGANATAITGGTLRGSAGGDLTITQNNTAGALTISSIISDNTTATALTKGGAGTLILGGANTYSGPTYVTQGTLISTGSLGSGQVNVGVNGNLQIGNGTANGVLPNFGSNLGTVTISPATAQNLTGAFNTGPNFNFLANAAGNNVSLQTGVFIKTGPGTLTLSNVLLTSQFHPQAGTTVIASGGNVQVGNFVSVGRLTGDNATLNVNGAGKLTVNGDFNAGDLAGSNGVVNVSDAASVNLSNFYLGKTGNATGIFNQSGFSTVALTGGADKRIGGGGGAGDVNAYGAYKMTSGTFTTVANTQVGAYGYGVLTQEGGTSTYSTWLTPGRFTGGNGVINIQGGSLTQNAQRVIVGENGTGALNVGVANSAATPYSAGQMFLLGGLSSGNAGGVGNTNLWYGGLLNAATVGDHNANPTDGTSTFNFHGGILQARANSTVALPLFGGGSVTNNNGALTAAYVGLEGANIDTNTFAATVVQPLLAPTGDGLASISVGTGGTGYQAEPLVQITGGGGTGATARAIVSGGVVTGFQITNPGVNYTSAPTIALVGGVPATAATIGTAATAPNVATGGLTKLGAGTMTFTSNLGSLGTVIGTPSTYQGATTVNGGTLLVDFSAWNQTPADMINAASPLVLGGGILSVNGHPTVATAPTGVTGTFAITQNIITLNAANAGVVVGETVTGTGIPAGAIVTAVNGTGITISANTTAAGAAAALTFGTFTGAAASQTFASTTLNPGANAVNALLNAGAGTTINLGAITRNAGSSVDFAIPATGAITTVTPNAAGTILGGWATANGGASFATSAGVAGTPGAITPLPAASYTANTWAAGANIDATASSTQAASAVANSLRFNSAAAVTVTLGTGSSSIDTGGILVTPTVAAFASTIAGNTLTTAANADLIVNQFNTNAAGALTISSIIASNGTGGLVKAGGGVLAISGVNTYAGDTVIGAGTLRLGIATAIPDGAAKGNVLINAGATLDLNNFSETINGLSGYGTVTTAVAGTPTFTVGGNNVSSTFSGTILNGTGTGTILTKTGTGTLTLNNVAAGTYTGATNISAGAIKIASPNSLANNTTINVNAANGLLFDTTIPTISGLGGNSTFALQTTATSALPNTAVQLSVGNNGAGGTYSGVLTGSGTLVKIGAGAETLSGANTQQGGFIVNAGTLVLSGNNAGVGGLTAVNNTGVLQINTAASLPGTTGRTVFVNSGGTVTFLNFTANPSSLGFSTISSLLSRIDSNSLGSLALQSDGTLQTPITENLDFSANALNLSLGSMLTGTSGLGTSPVVYTGVITPNASTFRIGGGGGRLILPNGATLGGANSLVVGGAAGTGLSFLTGAFGFTGSTTINNGTTLINTVANAGVSSSLGAGGAAASNLVLNAGTLQYVGNGSSTDRLFTLSAAPTALDASGSAPINFTNSGALGFLNSGNRTFTLQGSNTGANTLGAAINDSVQVAGNSGVLANGLTALQKNGNGTWVLSGTNTFTGGITVNNGVLEFTSPAAMGGIGLTGPANIFVTNAGAVAFGPEFGSIQAGLNRLSPTNAAGNAVFNGTAALTTNTSENLNFGGGATGAALPQITLGAYGSVSYNGTLTPFGGTYRLGGGGGVLTLPNGGLTGARNLIIAGGGPGANLVNNPNLNGAVVLGGTSDFSGGTAIATGSILSASSLTALGSGPLKFQGGFYRVGTDATDITVAADGTSDREIRIGLDTNASAVTANVDVVATANATFSRTFGMAATLGSNQGQAAFTKWGGGSLTLANGINLTTSNGTNNVATNSGTLTIERGTLSLLNNPTNYVGNIQVGSNNGGVGTLKLGANNVFANTTAQFVAASVIDLYNGSKLDLNGFSDTIRNIRGSGSVVNTGAGSPTLTTGTVNAENMIWGGNLAGNFTLKRVGGIAYQFGTGGNSNGIELWNNFNPSFTGKFIADGGGLRFRADGTLGSTSEPFAADKITLNNAGVLYPTGNPLVLGANRGITIGAGGGMIWAHNGAPVIINGPITGPGMLSIANDNGSVYLASDTNSWAGGTTVNSSSAQNGGFLVIGTGGATGNLPAGDVFLNAQGGTSGRLYFFHSNNITVPNNINGPGIVLQVGGGTTTFTGNNTTNNTIWVGGGRYKADFSTGNSPVGTGQAVNINGGAFEYAAGAGDNTLRLGNLGLGAFTGPPTGFNGSLVGDSAVQSTYGGSGSQNLIFGGNSRANTGSTMNFVLSGGSNGVTNSIRFASGPALGSLIGAAYYFNGSDFAANDINGFVRAANYGADSNTAPLNTLITGRFSKLTTSLLNQGTLQPAGINLSGSGTNLSLAAGAVLTLNANPGALLKSGGGTSVVSGASGGGAGAISTLNNNAQELILRSDTAADILQIDVPIAGTGQLTKSGAGQLTLTAANTYTGATFIDQGIVQLSGNGSIGTTGSGEIRISLAQGQNATVNVTSASSVVQTGTGANALRVGEGGDAIFNQSAGIVTAARYLSLGENLGSSGTYNLSGGTLNVKTDNSGAWELVVGRAGAGSLNISGSSVLNVNNGAQIQLGVGTANPGQFQGMIPNNGLSTGVGSITQTGGTVTVATTNGGFQSNIFGQVVLGVDGSGSYTLNGGTLNTPMLGRGNGTAAFTLGSSVAGTSGTLKATAGTLNVTLPINLTGTGTDKGTIDTNGNDITFTGAFTGVGGLKKAGAGTLNAIGSGNSFSGGTDITGGNLVASGTGLGSGAVNVGGTGTLTIQGAQQGLLASFYLATTTGVTPNLTTGGTAIQTEFTSLESFNAFVAGKAAVAIESTAARGKISLDYLEIGGANGTTALPPALITLSNGSNPFVGQLAGKFNATTTGDYTFQTRSDDATVLWIDGQAVVDNNRAQGQTTRTGTVYMTAGLHDITVGYYQGTGGGGFSVGVTQPGQGQSFTIGSELQLSNSLLSYGSSSLNIGALSGATGAAVQLNGGTLTTSFDTATSTYAGALNGIAGSALVKGGTGTLALTGDSSASFAGTTTVSAGALRVSGSIAGSVQVNVNDSASLILSGTGDRIGNNTPVILGNGPGALASLILDNSLGQISETAGVLSLSNNAVIDLGTGAAGSLLSFSASNGAAWSAGSTLSIYNWSGALGGTGTTDLDKIFFGSTSGTLTSAQLSQISFFSGNGSGLVGGAKLLGTGQLVPVPEPSTWMLGGAMLGLLGLRERRRISRALAARKRG